LPWGWKIRASHLSADVPEVYPFQRPALVDSVSLSTLPYCFRSVSAQWRVPASDIKDRTSEMRKSFFRTTTLRPPLRTVGAIFLRPRKTLDEVLEHSETAVHVFVSCWRRPWPQRRRWSPTPRGPSQAELIQNPGEMENQKQAHSPHRHQGQHLAILLPTADGCLTSRDLLFYPTGKTAFCQRSDLLIKHVP
jgi:hypothetical protein